MVKHDFFYKNVFHFFFMYMYIKWYQHAKQYVSIPEIVAFENPF